MDDLEEIYKDLEHSANNNNIKIPIRNPVVGEIVVIENWYYDKGLSVPCFGTLISYDLVDEDEDDTPGANIDLHIPYKHNINWWFKQGEFRLATSEEIKTGIIGSK
jgi:hypothetical protein